MIELAEAVAIASGSLGDAHLGALASAYRSAERYTLGAAASDSWRWAEEEKMVSGFWLWPWLRTMDQGPGTAATPNCKPL